MSTDDDRKDPKDEPAEPTAGVFDMTDYSGMSGAAAMHDQIVQQVSELLAGSDLSEDEKQKILAQIVCPCCGGAGPSMVFDLNPSKGDGPVY
jgi:hypothetical protein